MKSFSLIVSFIFIAVLVSCKGTKKTTEFNNYTLEQLADIDSKDVFDKTYKDIPHTHDVGLFDEGTTERAYTTLYPNSPKEILLIWKTPKGEDLYQVVLSKKGTWHSKLGLSIGSSYDRLIELNKKPIKIFGFGWDYSGAVDWNAGKLDGKNIHVFLKPATDPDPKFYGDGIINPTAEELEALQLTVGKIIVQKE